MQHCSDLAFLVFLVPQLLVRARQRGDSLEIPASWCAQRLAGRWAGGRTDGLAPLTSRTSSWVYLTTSTAPSAWPLAVSSWRRGRACYSTYS